MEPSEPWYFSFRSFKIINSVYFMILVLFTLSILSWLSFGSWWILWKWSIFFLSCQIYECKVAVFLLLSFNDCEIDCDVPYFIPDISALCLISCLCQPSERFYQILERTFFQRNSFLSHWFSLLFYYFQFHWSYALIFIASFLLIALGLFCSSCSSFLGWACRLLIQYVFLFPT